MVRFAIRLLVPLTVIALVACGAEPAPVGERFPTAAEAPGIKADPDEQRQTTEDFDEFLVDLTPALMDADREEMTTVFPEEDFVRSGVDFRFYGETHSQDAPHLISWYIEFDSDDAATEGLDYLEADAMKPCPRSCAFVVSSFDVEGIPDARGVHRIATAEDIEAAGFPGQVPSDRYWIGFTIDPVLYTIDLHGPPGSVTEDQAQEIANAFYERLTS